MNINERERCRSEFFKEFAGDMLKKHITVFV
ncbi:hypothetical protein FNP_0974 [Fusobacterium polymorphum ATCC 10953]|uniref:Transposase n=1 Tax=Fusobacterium polymorphum ATCC 10953 TaxID=393480 RepID=A5TV45_FUSNP|nr:hypothetical protein FNP_0974 [Fusobacterium polymorphum ATCC 10953]